MVNVEGLHGTATAVSLRRSSVERISRDCLVNEDALSDTVWIVLLGLMSQLALQKCHLQSAAV